MTQKKITKTKVKKVVKKTTSPRAKKNLRSTDHVDKKASAVLLSTDMSGVSMTHGHSPYHHRPAEITKKKIDDHSKNLIMYIGISFIMVVIVIFWIISLKSSLGSNTLFPQSESKNEPDQQADFQELKDNFSKTLSEVKGEIKSLEEAAKVAPATSVVNPLPPSNTVSPVLPNTLPN